MNSWQIWTLAARPKTLTGAAIPVLLGGALAIQQQGWNINYAVWVGCLLFAFLMQIDANFINDIYDYLKGTDREDRLGPQRACAQGWVTPKQMKRAIALVTLTACVVGLLTVWAVWQQLPYHGGEFIVLGVLCVAGAFLYTTKLSYLGWGDILVLLFFGLVPVCGTYYLLCLSLPTVSYIVGLISGIAIDTLLIVNNYRDRDQDLISGKRTIVVKLGARFALLLHRSIGWIVALLIIITWHITGGTYLALALYMIPAIAFLLLNSRTTRHMAQIGQGRALNACLGETSLNMSALAILLSLALIASRLLG